MRTSSNYTIAIKKATDEQLLRMITEFIEKAEFAEKMLEFDYSDCDAVKAEFVIQSKGVVVEEACKDTLLDDIMTFVRQIIKIAPDAEFSVDGYVDCTKNEYPTKMQSFKISYEDHLMTTCFSGWYYEVHLDGYDSYEGYVEEAKEYEEVRILSKEEFERFRNAEELFLLEDDGESLVEEVPLDNELVEKFDAEGNLLTNTDNA